MRRMGFGGGKSESRYPFQVTAEVQGKDGGGLDYSRGCGMVRSDLIQDMVWM